MQKFDFLKEAERFYKIFVAPDAKEVPRKRVRLNFRSKQRSIQSKLTYLYGEERAKYAYERIETKIKDFREIKPTWLKYKDANFRPQERFTEKDTILITYPDFIRDPGKPPLQVLYDFSARHLKAINTIHILPFYPYSSDRGFSVINYKLVKKNFGTWKDISRFRNDFNMMFDCVFNHISSRSMWFKEFLKGNPLYQNHFITFEGKTEALEKELKKVARPRTTDLLTKFNSKTGPVYVWTTFGDDQVDLNFKEAVVLLRVIDIMLLYIRNGASIIRLDAIAYAWKELGTNSIYLRQTHVFVQLLRDILDIVAPSVSIVTETNVTHAQNIKYLGNGKSEAQMVYNFTLPPLVLHAFFKGDAHYLARWADSLEKVSENSTYFNFLASHDGIGIWPAKRTLPSKELNFLVSTAKKHGSLISYKNTKNGRSMPYELNVTWWDALNNNNQAEGPRMKKRRFLASIALALSLRGVPGIYFHSLFGTKNDNKAVLRTKSRRDINRKNLNLATVEKDLERSGLTAKIFRKHLDFISIRTKQKAFHPNADQQMLFGSNQIFAMIRTSQDKTEKILVLVNVTDKDQMYRINLEELGLYRNLYELLSGRRMLKCDKHISINDFTITLRPYEVNWIRSKE